jgi:Histidine kinase-, DNA gyrase B-, and HSP90-like ATPase
MLSVKDPIEKLHSTGLYSCLAEQSSEYADLATKFVAGIAPILATTQQHFPLYTRHDAHHGFRVVCRLSQIVDEDCFKSDNPRTFQPIDIFLLITAAYAHDLGMTVFPGEEVKLIKTLMLDESDWKTDEKLTHYLRTEHSKRGGQYILEKAAVLGVPTNLVSPLNALMQSHNLSISEINSELQSSIAAGEKIVDLRQLAAILCIGDAIEFSDTRVLDGVLARAMAIDSEAARISYRENRKHDCIRDSLALDDFGQIFVSGTFTEPDVLALAHQTFDQMEKWIRGYCDIDRDSKVPRLRIRPEEFRRQLVIPGADFERLGVRMSKRSVIDLIASNAVWRNDPGIAIRELIQNAVEACRYRKHHASDADRYSPLVSVIFDRANKTIQVTDNGCGMSKHTVKNHFLTVGSSRSKEPEYANENYASIARFGIGFWSVFTIAVRAKVETCSTERGNLNNRGFSFDVTLDELKDYTVFVTKALPAGTSVTLYLKSDVVLDDVYERARSHLLSAAVPIKITFEDEETLIPPNVSTVTAEELLGPRVHAMKEMSLLLFQYKGGSKYTDFSMAFVYREEDGKPTFQVNENASVISHLRRSHSSRTAICGFVASMVHQRTCFAIQRVGAFHANHRSPEGFVFSLDRQALTENESLRLLAGDVTDLVHEGYREFLKQNNAYRPEAIFRLNETSELAGGNVFDVYTGPELARAYERYPDLLCFRLWPVSPELEFTQATPIYVDLNQLLAMSGQCWMIQSSIQQTLANGRLLSAYPEQLIRVAYDIVRKQLTATGDSPQAYVMDPNRPSSMLFDADPESSIAMIEINPWGNGTVNCILQHLNLANLKLNCSGHDVLVEIQGRWTGAVYRRDFNRPDGKPYAFLGRHRVFVKRHSKLDAHLAGLEADGRTLKIAATVFDLTEDEAGFPPSSLNGIL